MKILTLTQLVLLKNVEMLKLQMIESNLAANDEFSNLIWEVKNLNKVLTNFFARQFDYNSRLRFLIVLMMCLEQIIRGKLRTWLSW